MTGNRIYYGKLVSSIDSIKVSNRPLILYWNVIILHASPGPHGAFQTESQGKGPRAYPGLRSGMPSVAPGEVCRTIIPI